jgi:hypothetical protein
MTISLGNVDRTLEVNHSWSRGTLLYWFEMQHRQCYITIFHVT